MPLPVRRKRSGPGTPLQPNGTATGPWSRPATSIVPNEPVQRLGAPPGMLGAGEGLPPWGVPASPPRGFPAARDDDADAAVEIAVPDTDGVSDDDELAAGVTVPTEQVTEAPEAVEIVGVSEVGRPARRAAGGTRTCRAQGRGVGAVMPPTSPR